MPNEWVANQNIIEMEYAVRGPIPARAAEMQRAGRKTIFCNVGNPQALGQKPLSFNRRVLSLMEYPERIATEWSIKSLARDGRITQEDAARFEGMSDYVLERAEAMLRGFEEHGLGAYTSSKGPEFIRETVSTFINERDGVDSASSLASDPEQVFLTNGASEGVTSVLELLISGPKDGVMIPIPQYPLYSATLERLGGVQVGYFPNEDDGWSLEPAALEDSLKKAQADGVTVKAIVVINPGNPTGAILPDEAIEAVVAFAARHGIGIIADEVYQPNTYGEPFTSFAKVVADRDVPLFSFHSVSKGFTGACGRRGGYLEVRNPPKIKGTEQTFTDLLVKRASVNLCSNTVGQAMIHLMVSPPDAGSEPYDEYVSERDGILSALYDKAVMIREAFQEMDGVRCFGRTGAMYLFPRLEKLPKGASDFDYCMALLERTGLCTVNGTGFGQATGTQHLRIAFLPSKELLEEVLPEWIAWHNEYVNA
jgi:aspartate/methionine/tyrosine aminotransferase